VPLIHAIAVATERRPFLKQQRAAIFGQRDQIRIAMAGYLPTVRASGGYEFQSSPFSDNIRDVSSGYTVGATGNWPIFDGFQTAGRVKQARAQLATAQINYDDAVRQVELEVQQAYSNLQQGSELIRSQEENVAQAEEALRLASARLSAGAGTQLEVLNSRVEVTRAQSVRLQALFSYVSAQAEFDRVTSMDTEYHVTYNDPLRGRQTRTERITAKEEAQRAKIDDLRPPRTTTTTTTRTTTRRQARPGK
jgi:outer membrane protein TolC